MIATNELPSGWVETTLEHVAAIRDDLREPVNREERAKRVGPYPYYGATGQVGWIDDYKMDGEYVLLGEDGAPFLDPIRAKAYMVSGKCWVNNHAHVLLGKPGVCTNRFLLYTLNSLDYREFVRGTTRLKLTQRAMRELPIRLPPIPIQEAIVAKIDELFSDLDAGVAALERARANLKRYRASVLKAAVEGKLTEQWRAEHPDVEPASALLERILAERRKKWEEEQLRKYEAKGKKPPKGWRDKYREPFHPDPEELPKLPDTWCWASIDEISYYLRNGLSKKPAAEPPGVPILRINAVRPMLVDLNEVRYYTDESVSLDDYVLENGDLLFTRYNGSVELLGVAGLVRGCEMQLLHPDKLMRLKTVLQSPFPEYVEIAANVGASRTHMVGRARTTAGQTGVSGGDVREMPIPLSPLSEQGTIVSLVEEAMSIVRALEDALAASEVRASRLRQAILKRAFEGKLIGGNEAGPHAKYAAPTDQSKNTVELIYGAT